MDAREFTNIVRNADGYVRITFPPSALGLRCLKNLMAAGEVVGMLPSAADRNEIKNAMMVGWSSKTTFSFMHIGKIDDNTLYQLARDIERAY